MAITNGYCSLAILKERLRVGDDLDSSILESLITGASRAIDQWLGRRFYAASETRVYTPTDGARLRLANDLLSITTLKTDEDGDRTYEVTWSASLDYYLLPTNATLDSEPYTEIEIDQTNGHYRFPCYQRSTQIVGSFGYCATGSQPAPVEEATLRLTERLFKLRDAPLGVAGSAETGLIRISTDRDLQELLWPYRRRLGFA